MSAEQATSVSKGVFAFKGKCKRVNEDDYVCDSKDRGRKARMTLYREIWEDLHTQIEILRSDLNCQIFDDLIAFVSGCHRHRDSPGDRSAQLLGEIPAAVLVTGVNTPDHDVMFANLESMLKSQVSPLVARVGAQDNCRISALLSDIVAQLMNVTLTSEEREDDEHDAGDLLPGEKSTAVSSSPIKLKVAPVRKRALNLTTLVKWYKKKFGAGSPCKSRSAPCSPRKRLKLEETGEANAEQLKATTNGSGVDKKPLVIIVFEDVENVNPAVFQDFISLCCSYLPSLPIVLILGIATAVTAIHQILPSAITSLLCMERFQAPPASRYLSHLMDKIVMVPDVAVKLGPKVFHFLLDTFLYHDFSILNFITAFQFCMSEHFLSNPLSVLCCGGEEVDYVTSQLSQAQLEDLRKLASFKSFVESCPPNVQSKLWSDNAVTRKYLSSALTELHQHHANLFPALRFLHCLSSALPKHPLGKQFRELYSLCLTTDVCESDSYKQAVTFLRLMSLDDLSKALAAACQALEEPSQSNEHLRPLFEEVERFVYRLGHLDEEEEQEEEKDMQQDANGVPLERILPQRTKLHELKEKLQSMSSKRRKSPYEKLREEILESLQSHLRRLITCPLTLPLHEALYFNDLAAVKEQLKAAPRCSTQRALTLPGRYLNCACCHGNEHSILPSMPDICIVYKLHLECGTLVNLYDWLQAFVTIITAAGDKGGKSKKKPQKPSTELRARFIRAVSELQFLGFIKSTRRKTDHVTRLTW
ncbi:origin recognition complex subunit 3 [Aplysia californica]|uniref:Origin recognition complex subunit 3 n=1 Tax=Aplysia californica TaxID=6500 RepID=A0ABM0JLQ1_APLCA|nr:origin recognition complex subunit 3 [Aplysia californica]